MKTIWKYPLSMMDKQVISLPVGSKILCAQIQNDTACIWVLVDPENKQIKREIMVFGTGHPVDDSLDLEYIGTFQIASLGLVFHVFDAGIVK
jgi:hypothetical protein